MLVVSGLCADRGHEQGRLGLLQHGLLECAALGEKPRESMSVQSVECLVWWLVRRAAGREQEKMH